MEETSHRCVIVYLYPKPVVVFDYSCSRAQDVPLRLLEGYQGYSMTDDYAVAEQPGIERLGCWAQVHRMRSINPTFQQGC